MPFCPKCEQEYRAGFEICAECRVPLTATLERKRSLDQVEEDFAASMFPDERESVSFCPQCLNEFAPTAKSCGPCGGGRLMQAEPSRLAEIVSGPPLEQMLLPAPPRALADRVLVYRARTPAEAGWIVDQLGAMGVTPDIGTDASDNFDDPAAVGVYVPADEVEAAQMLLPEDASEFEEERPRGKPYERALQTADGYREIQKYQYALHKIGEAIQLDPARFDAYLALGHLYSEMGDVPKALEMFREVRQILGDRDSTDAPLAIAALTFRGPDGQARFTGAAGEKALGELRFYVARHPRHMAALKLLLEAFAARGDKAPGRELTKHVRKVNQGFFNDSERYGLMAAQLEG
jgi:tetratricopeptide (TPR) repeat protein